MGDRQVAEEIRLYQQYGSGVVRVQAGLSVGTGFFVAGPEPLILTNEHVVVAGPTVSVVLASGVRVAAQVVARDASADLALLRVPPSICIACPRLPLANLDELHLQVQAGERVVVLGYPLHQPLTLTAGIVSAVLERALISDVSANPGNSGGPMLNLAGHVVGVTTFADQGAIGPGLAGAVRIDQARNVIADALASLPSLEPLLPETLPVLDKHPYPLEALRTLTDSLLQRDATPYEGYIGLPAGSFRVDVFTPAARYTRRARLERRVARGHQPSSGSSDTTDSRRYIGFEPRHDWVQYVGGLTSPGVLLNVTPELKSRGCGYEGDLYELAVRRNGRLMNPVIGGIAPSPLWCDIAFGGVYVLQPEVFEPGPGPLPPRITLSLHDLKAPEDARVYPMVLPTSVVAQVWNDFGPYHRSRGAAFTTARPDVLPFSQNAFTFRGSHTGWIAEQAITEVLAAEGFRVDEVVPEQRLVTWYVARNGSTDEVRVYLQRGRAGEYFFAVWSDRGEWNRRLTTAIQRRFPDQ